MKIGDFVLNMDINYLNEKLKNMSSNDLDLVKAKSLAVAFLADMAIEVLEAPSMLKKNLKPNDMAMFTVEVLAGAAAANVFRMAQRTNNKENYINMFKHFFELNLQLIGKIGNDN